MSVTTSALKIISSASLSPTEHLLLTDFVEGAVDSLLAATYLVSRVEQDDEQDVVASLQRFKDDWRKLVERLTTYDPVPEFLDYLVRKRDGPRCSLTKNSQTGSVSTVEPAYLLPPSMLHSLETVEEGHLFTMLGAFLSPSWIARLRTELVNAEEPDEACLKNAWLLSPSVHRAFREGHVAVKMGFRSYSNEDSKYDQVPENQNNWYVLDTLTPGDISSLSLGDGTTLQSLVRFKLSSPDPKTLPTPSVFLFEVHRRLAYALHLFSIEDQVARGWPRPPKDLLGFDFPVLRRIFYHAWLCMPTWIRLRCYLLLRTFGRYLYGPGLESSVQRLPFGLILKHCFRAPQNEPNALRVVERYTSIPAPRVVDVGDYDGTTIFLMTHVSGQMLGDVMHLMSYAERDRLADDLGSCIRQLRNIANPTPFLFCNTLGGPIVDHRIPDGYGGPFHSESDFNNHLTSHLGCSPSDIVGDQHPRQDHRSFFTHSDFHCTNLLVDRGRLSGIIDWECAGFLPEYWEFTKAMYSTRQNPILEGIFRRAFAPHRYESELTVERKLWAVTPFGS